MIEDMKVGVSVKAKLHLGNTRGMAVADKFLLGRRAGEEGIVEGYFPSLGGDVWAVKHEEGVIGAYCFNELDLLMI